MKLTEGGFKIIREKVGKLSQEQVDGFNFLVESMNSSKFTYPQAAYGLATAWIETANTMQPIEEYGSDKYLSKYDTGTLAKRLGNTQAIDKDGQKYKGRGYVQITGTDNYRNVGKLIGVDLLNNPELALDHDIAAKILTGGMLNGWFTGVGFLKKRPVSKYNKEQYVAARNIINGSDRAKEIADLAMVFEKALRSY